MRGTSILKSPSRKLEWTGEMVSPRPQNSGRRLLPYNLIDGAVICSDAILILTTSVLTGVLYHFAFLDSVGTMTAFLSVGTLTFVNFSAILAARANYRPEALTNFWKQVRETTATWLFVFFVLLAVAFSFKVSEEYSRGAILAFFAVGWTAIIAWRLAVAHLIVHALAIGAFAEQRTILLAEEAQLDGSSAVEELKRCGYTPVRTFKFARNSISSIRTSPRLLETVNEIIDICRQQAAACVFVLASWDDRVSIEQLMKLLRPLSIPVYLLPDRNVAHFFGSRIVSIGTAWTAELQRAPLSAFERACKRALDLLIASVVLIMLAPLMLLVAALIKLDNRGPIFFIQTRNGFNGRPFRMYKFRTMSVMEDGSEIRQATKNDSRFTRCGPLLRRLSIDELPQLFNVIRGEMSLVGPRPHAAAHDTKYQEIISNYAFRHHVKPGLTGWAQINGFRGETQTVELMARRVEFDLWYINNWSYWLDFKILLRTLIVGLQPTAY
jgi:Undecaprenyl-phosphate glucose phosphotransferase